MSVVVVVVTDERRVEIFDCVHVLRVGVMPPLRVHSSGRRWPPNHRHHFPRQRRCECLSSYLNPFAFPSVILFFIEVYSIGTGNISCHILPLGEFLAAENQRLDKLGLS